MAKMYKLFGDDQIKSLNYFIESMAELGYVQQDAETGIWKITGSIDEMGARLGEYIGLSDGVTV